VTYEYPFEYEFAGNDPFGAEEAKRRAKEFRSVDPFPEVPPALLSSEHISDYVRVTGMLHPFYPAADRLKSASYEARPRRFVRWDNEGRKIVTDIGPEETYELPENSITFVQIESKIRLPEYIALRFNLRIRHVHRGLLLGTGPLVDPGFTGDLLIPLHNLTSEKYPINGNEGIIWIEFTKTTHNPDKWPSKRGHFYAIEAHKTDVPIHTYFERANGSNPIQSSIPSFIKDAKEFAQRADVSARKAVRTNRLFASVGILAIAGLIIGAGSTALSVVKDTAQAKAEAERVVRESEVQRGELEQLKRSANQASSDAARALGENVRLKNELDQTLRQLAEIDAQMRSLRGTR
jgi:deoxycytidine triphosphate deaminase